MWSRLRTTWFAGSGALILVLAISGAALGATVLSSASEPADDATAPLVGDTAATFVDADGDGIADECDTEVVPDETAAAAALAAVDTNSDGVVSVTEAAQSDRTGGKNCNHGGYVSVVANAACDATTVTPTAPDAGTTDPADTDETEADENDSTDADDADKAETADPCSTDAALTAPEDAPVCVPVAAPVYDPALFAGPGGFGAYVSSVAKSDAVGGKNCNHGGAVSEAVKAAREAARAERDAAREAARAERDAAKAEARAARDATKAERAAQRALDRAERQAKVKTRSH